jgi:hypothetical protein
MLFAFLKVWQRGAPDKRAPKKGVKHQKCEAPAVRLSVPNTVFWPNLK